MKFKWEDKEKKILETKYKKKTEKRYVCMSIILIRWDYGPGWCEGTLSRRKVGGLGVVYRPGHGPRKALSVFARPAPL